MITCDKSDLDWFAEWAREYDRCTKSGQPFKLSHIDRTVEECARPRNELVPRRITLNARQLAMATEVGKLRRSESLRLGFAERNGVGSQSEAFQEYTNVLGAMGELAFSVLFDLEWLAGVNQAKSEPDVLPDWQVRTRQKSDAELPVRKDDLGHFKYVLMVGRPTTFTYCGWIRGDKMRRQWWGDRAGRNKPCYWVPQSALQIDL